MVGTVFWFENTFVHRTHLLLLLACPTRSLCGKQQEADPSLGSGRFGESAAVPSIACQRAGMQVISTVPSAETFDSHVHLHFFALPLAAAARKPNAFLPCCFEGPQQLGYGGKQRHHFGLSKSAAETRLWRQAASSLWSLESSFAWAFALSQALLSLLLSVHFAAPALLVFSVQHLAVSARRGSLSSCSHFLATTSTRHPGSVSESPES